MTFFLKKTTNKILMYLSAKKKKQLTVDLERMHHFWAKNSLFAPNKNYFGKYY